MRRSWPVALFSLLLLFPITTRVSMHAEIVSSKPYIVTAPINGVIKQVHVSPGQKITPGMLVAELDQREILAEIAVREKEIIAARAEFDRLTRLNFADNSAGDRLEVARASIETARANLDVSRQKLNRSRIIADVSGVAVLSEPSRLQGAPVSAGQQILQIADQNNVEVNFLLPLTDTYLFVGGDLASLVFIPDDHFFQGKSLNLRYCEYDPSRNSLGLIGHQCRAIFTDGQSEAFGSEGTVVAYGPRMLLAFALLRKPFLYVRAHLGF